MNNDEVLKGTLVSIAADNLGANSALCMAESFRTFHYCRICKLSREECQLQYEDNLQLYRNDSHYSEMLEIVNDSEKVNLKETLGIKRYCKLNDLSYFSIFKNVSVDIMHDLNEGIIAFSLDHVFLYRQKNKVLKEEDLKYIVKSYQYPMYFRQDKPSILNFNRNNFGQNASQMKCLFLNFPFILSKYEHNVHLKKIWPCVTSLLDIFHIVHSTSIDNPMLEELQECVKQHLEMVVLLFEAGLIPKLHFMIHYANIIRMMGPIIYMSMIRFDAKHTDFKKFVRTTNNFMNINKTLAVKHNQNWQLAKTHSAIKLLIQNKK